MMLTAIVAAVTKNMELNDLVSTLRGSKLKLWNSYMEDTCNNIL